jgi:feruloyl esterase
MYYSASPHHSYYNGCSAGGRQGISVASRYPDTFDGVLIGSPALDWNRYLGANEVWASFVAANTSSAIPLPQWSTIVTPEILRQCDSLDGKVDGIIADPSLCSWDPESLLCGRPGDNVTGCLTQDQVDGLKKFYQPILGINGDVVAPAFDPGAEGDLSFQWPMNGIASILTAVGRSHS